MRGITTSQREEVCRIRKDVQLDLNDAQSTWIWVITLQSQEDFVYYKDK